VQYSAEQVLHQAHERGVIVEGRMQATTFSTVIGPERIHIRTNFAEDFLFFTEQGRY
jgi:hypothetical protein